MFGFGKRITVQEAATVPYLYNDPIVPNLVGTVPLPMHPKKLDFYVRGYNRQEVTAGTEAAQAANCYVTVANCINYLSKNMVSYGSDIKKWAAVSKLAVMPRAGRMLNAYYDRSALKFFYEPNRATGKMFYTADSTDIVAHELGHAVLDAIRPDFWSVQALEIWSFHESFADITAMLSIMQYDAVLHYALTQTNANLRTPNVISELAEEFGHNIFGNRALRSAINNFNYVDPATLPKNAPDDKLAAECHSFGRVFLGAWYDIFVGIYETECQKHSPFIALQIARDTAAELLLRAVPRAPRTVNFYSSISKTMLNIAKSKGSPYEKLMETVFRQRRLAMPDVKILSDKSLNDIRFSIQKGDEVMRSPAVSTVKLARAKTFKLGAVSSLSVNGLNLSNVEVEVPYDSYYVFDRLGRLVDEILPNDEEITEMVNLCVGQIAMAEEVGPDINTMWEIKKNKLTRSFIV